MEEQMRENWDYVTMETYSADMAEQTNRATGIIEQLSRKNRELERAIAAIVLAAGRIEVPTEHLQDPMKIVVTRSRNDESMTVIFEARRA